MDNFRLQKRINNSRDAQSIAIYALATHLPEMSEHNSLLGSVVRSAYNHLYHPAGNFSRPSIVRRGVKRMYSPVYIAPTAGEQERTADLAAIAVGRLMASIPQAREVVSAVFHNQCTLDQQIVGSGCLRIQGDYFGKAEQAMMIGQLGTAGIPTVFRLASLGLQPGQLTSISASDKWIAPFVRCVPDMLTYGDASAACLAGAIDANVAAPIAVIENIATRCVPPPGDLWTTPPATQRQYLLDHARITVEALLAQRPELQREQLVLIGDGFSCALAVELSAACGIHSMPNTCSAVHLSSASPLFALSNAIGLAVERCQEQHAVIWTVSQAGHAGAMLVRANPGALDNGGVWLTPNTFGFDQAATLPLLS